MLLYIKVWAKEWALLFAGIVLRCALHVTGKLATDFEARLVKRVFMWLFNKKGNEMKTIFESSNKRFSVTEADGKVDFKVDGQVVDTVDAMGLLTLGGNAIVHALPPAVQPLGTVIEGVLIQAAKALE